MAQRYKPDAPLLPPLLRAPTLDLNNAVFLELESHVFRLGYAHSVIDEVSKHLNHRRLSLQQFLELVLQS